MVDSWNTAWVSWKLCRSMLLGWITRWFSLWASLTGIVNSISNSFLMCWKEAVSRFVLSPVIDGKTNFLQSNKKHLTAIIQVIFICWYSTTLSINALFVNFKAVKANSRQINLYLKFTVSNYTKFQKFNNPYTTFINIITVIPSMLPNNTKQTFHQITWAIAIFFVGHIIYLRRWKLLYRFFIRCTGSKSRNIDRLASKGFWIGIPGYPPDNSLKKRQFVLCPSVRTARTWNPILWRACPTSRKWVINFSQLNVVQGTKHTRSSYDPQEDVMKNDKRVRVDSSFSWPKKEPPEYSIRWAVKTWKQIVFTELSSIQNFSDYSPAKMLIWQLWFV